MGPIPQRWACAVSGVLLSGTPPATPPLLAAAAGMPAGIDFCPIELPGRAARMGEPPITRIDALLDVLSRTIQPLMNVPFAFFGHRPAQRWPIRRPAICAPPMGARRCTSSSPPGRRPARARLRVGGNAVRQRVALMPGRFGGTPDIVLARDELIAALLPMMRADLALGESCAAADRLLDCPVSVFGGESDAIETSGLRPADERSVPAELLAGGHFYLAECRNSPARLHAICMDTCGSRKCEARRRAG